VTNLHWLLESIEKRKKPLANIFLDRLPQLRETLSGSDATRCRLCNAPDISADDIGGEVQLIYCEDRCQRCGEFSLMIGKLEARLTCGPNRTQIDYPIYCMCVTHECDGPMRVPGKPKYNVERYDRLVPFPKIIGNRIENHHVNYDPEAIIPVCKNCHSTIHDDSDELSELKPEQSRKEWEADDG